MVMTLLELIHRFDIITLYYVECAEGVEENFHELHPLDDTVVPKYGHIEMKKREIMKDCWIWESDWQKLSLPERFVNFGLVAHVYEGE